MGMADEACCEREKKKLHSLPKGRPQKVQEPQYTQEASLCHILTLDPKSQNPLADHCGHCAEAGTQASTAAASGPVRRAKLKEKQGKGMAA